jgi:hypothetical protein
MKKALLILTIIVLTLSMLLSGCTQPEDVTVTETETTTVTTTQPQYSINVEKAVINESILRLEAAGLWPQKVSGIVHNIGLMIGFYGDADAEALAIVNQVIDEMAPGLLLETMVNAGPISLYPQMLMEAVFHAGVERLQSAGYMPHYDVTFPAPHIVAGFVYGLKGIELHFYGEIEPQAVNIVRQVINELAPGLPLITLGSVIIVVQ